MVSFNEITMCAESTNVLFNSLLSFIFNNCAHTIITHTHTHVGKMASTYKHFHVHRWLISCIRVCSFFFIFLFCQVSGGKRGIQNVVAKMDIFCGIVNKPQKVISKFKLKIGDFVISQSQIHLLKHLCATIKIGFKILTEHPIYQVIENYESFTFLR